MQGLVGGIPISMSRSIFRAERDGLSVIDLENRCPSVRFTPLHPAEPESQGYLLYDASLLDFTFGSRVVVAQRQSKRLSPRSAHHKTILRICCPYQIEGRGKISEIPVRLRTTAPGGCSSVGRAKEHPVLNTLDGDCQAIFEPED